MALRLNDRKLATQYGELEARQKSDPAVQVDDSNVVNLLSSVADTAKLTSAKALLKLNAPGVTREQQVALIQAGMSNAEKADLIQILDKGQVPISPSAFNFLNAVVGRDVVVPGAPLKITGDQKNGLAGIVGPGAQIEAVNLTTMQRDQDAVVVATSDAKGSFAAQVPGMQEGDFLKVRAKYADGHVGDWLTVKATGLGTDTRNAVVSAPSIKLANGGNGAVVVSAADAALPLSEPNAKLQFTNARSGQKTVVSLDAQGMLPSGVVLPGQSGDTFSVAISDGVNNADFSKETARLAVDGRANGTVDLPDPALHHDQINADGTPKNAKAQFTGPLFKDGVAPEDFDQGFLGDCYLCAASAAVALTHPDALLKGMKENGDGTYSVTFKQKDYATGKYKDVIVKVDGDLYVKPTGTPLYARGHGDKTPATMELWPSILEKAYAQYKGSYDRIGSGGVAADAMEALIGAPKETQSISTSNADAIFKKISDAAAKGWPICAGTYGDDQEAKYTNTGVYADHAYTVMGVEESNGEKFVKLRNPWGYSEPAGDGVDDGEFKLKLADFANLYRSLYVVQG